MWRKSRTIGMIRFLGYTDSKRVHLYNRRGVASVDGKRRDVRMTIRYIATLDAEALLSIAVAGT